MAANGSTPTPLKNMENLYETKMSLKENQDKITHFWVFHETEH